MAMLNNQRVDISRYSCSVWLKVLRRDPECTSVHADLFASQAETSRKREPKVQTSCFICFSYGYGSIPINTIFSGMNIHKSQLWLGVHQGYQGAMTHPHMFLMDFLVQSDCAWVFFFENEVGRHIIESRRFAFSLTSASSRGSFIQWPITQIGSICWCFL